MKSVERTVFETFLAGAVLLALAALPLSVCAEADMPHHPPAFNEFDQDGDGFVSETEFNATRAARHEAMAKEGRSMKGMANAPAFKDIDTDGDGKLTEAELTTAQQAHMKAMREAHAGMAGGAGQGMHHGSKMPSFEDIDLDGNGCISREEFDRHHAEMHPQKG